MNEPELRTPQEYARYRRCSIRTLDRERAEGRGCPFVKIGGRVLYRRSDIERFIEANVRGRGHNDRVAESPAGRHGGFQRLDEGAAR
jgi:hypothetical protein